MISTTLARRIETTGWSAVLLGVLCLFLSAVEAAMPRFLARFSEVLGSDDDPLRAMREAYSAGAGLSALVNGLFGLALIGIGIGVTRRIGWARPALEIACWASIAVLTILAKPSLAPLFVMAGEDATPGKRMLVATGVLVIAQIGAVLWFLRFWRKPEVRAAFR